MHAKACARPIGVPVRKMLEDMGVQVVEVPDLCDAAVYIEDVHVLLIRPGICARDLAAAAESVLLGYVPRPHLEPGTSS